MKEFKELLDCCWTGDAEETVDCVMKDLRMTRRQVAVLRSTLVWAAVHFARNRAQVVEEAVQEFINPIPPSSRRPVKPWRIPREVPADAPQPGQVISDFLRETFSTYDGHRVSWAEATVEQHEKRIAYQSALRDGITADIKRHEWAISAIRAAGVTCLGDIPGIKEPIVA